MAQILDPVPHNSSHSVLCSYLNATRSMQVVRITNLPNWYFERVVFPGQHLVFEALPDGVLEVHTGMIASAILSDQIPCSRLVVHNQNLDQAVAETESESVIAAVA